MSLKDFCPECDTQFEKEDGYFLGAFALNLIVAEVVGVAIVILLMFRTNLSLVLLETLGIAAMVMLPLAFFPFSRTCWMAISLAFERSENDEQLRGGELK